MNPRDSPTGKYTWKQFGFTWDYLERWEGHPSKAVTKRAFIICHHGKYFGKVYRKYPLENILFNTYESLEEIKRILETTVELLK